MARDRPGLTSRAVRLAAAGLARSPIGAKLAVAGGVTALGIVVALFLFLALFGVLLGGQATGQTVCQSSKQGRAQIPASLAPIYQRASRRYRLGQRGPSVLAAINQIETDFGRNQGPSSAGAIGFMQFMPSTWASYGVDANGDGRRDPADPEDAIHAAARYLRASGAPANWYRAVFSYNHADWYVQQVLDRADAFQGNCTTQAGPAPAQPLGDLDYRDTSGRWGGAEKFAKSLTALGRRYRCTPTSEKRQRELTANGNPSDHWVGSPNSYAVDLDSTGCSMTYPGGAADHTAQALAEALGMPRHTGIVDVIHGAYRFQLIWQASGHYDHVHIGVKRVG